MEEELRLAVETRRDRGMARRPPFAARFQQWLGLLDVGPERLIGDGDPDAVSRRTEIVAGVEEPVAALLPGDPRPLDQMPFPIEIVGEDQPVLADQRALFRQALGVDR